MGEQDKFCMRCGAARQEPARSAAADSSTVCPACGAAIDDSMRFCMHCGAELSPLPAAVASAAPVEPEPQRKRGMTKGAVAAIVAVTVAVIAIAAFGVWWFVLRDDASAQSGVVGTSLSGESSESSDSNDAGDATDSGDDDARGHASAEDESRTAVCTVPDASLSDVRLSGTSLIASVDFESESCEDSSYSAAGVQVTIQDDGNVVAAAVYDFGDAPLEFDDGTAQADLAFTTVQYWRPYDQIDVSDASVELTEDATASGASAATVEGALGGASIADTDIERYAQLAMSWQLDHDKTAANAFYSTFTTQLSSKQYGMQVEEKTWKYRDIYEQFLQRRAKHPNALFIWSGDYPTYQENGTTDFYVILSGEGFGSAADATAWCPANGYSTDDCIAVDLQ